MNLTLSKKQQILLNQVKSSDVPLIEVLGSAQSGKTFVISGPGLIAYAQALYKNYPDEYFYGAIIGWTWETIKGNILENIQRFLDKLGLVKTTKKKKGDYDLKISSDDKYFEIYNIKFFFFGFNNYLSFNKILGKPLIFIWVDEAARIYSQLQLQSTFDELPGRQISYAGHPFLKRINTYNVEGGENHPYKKKYIDKIRHDKNEIMLTFYPFDNPKIDTKEKIEKVVDTFATESLREQKIFNKWVVAEGKVFTKLNVRTDLKGLQMREIGIGIDYGSVNATTFVPLALCYDTVAKKWCAVRLEIFYYNAKELGTTPTTEFFSNQLRLFLIYLKQKYPHIPIYDLVVDSEATHFINRLDADNIPNTKATKGAGSVVEGVQYMQSLYYKDFLYIYDTPSIRTIRDDGSIEYCGKDEGLIEKESYCYDTPKSIKTGIDAYVKDMDHSIDAERYIQDEWKENGKLPVM